MLPKAVTGQRFVYAVAVECSHGIYKVVVVADEVEVLTASCQSLDEAADAVRFAIRQNGPHGDSAQ